MSVQFLLLGNGEERKHLVPVLKTVLQLSPQEASQLEHIASGETYLHLKVTGDNELCVYPYMCVLNRKEDKEKLTS